MVTVMKTEAIRGDWVGQVIVGRFPLLQWLGGNELSSIFLTEIQGAQPQKAAIRLTVADGTEADALIERWSAANALSHPHLMRLFDSGRCQIGNEQLVYAVTEYAEEKLSEILPERALTTAETREMLEPVLDALAYLHGKGFVHGRLKPSKIMVVNDKVKLSRDNIHAAGKLDKPARALEIHDAPECEGGTISPAADLWSLGVTVVEALTQRTPVWDRAAQSDPVVPESMPQPFAEIAREALRCDPAQRCSLGDVRARLEGTGSKQVLAVKPDRPMPSKIVKPVLIAAALGVVTMIAILSWQSHQTESLPTAADQQSAPATDTPPAPSPAAEKKSFPATKRRGSDGALVKGEVAERVLPNVLPRATASIHGQFNVKVRAAVDAGGAVSDATLDSPGPSKYFAKAALEAARQWKFKAAQVKGQAVASVWVLQFRFTRTGTEVTPVEVSP